MITQVNCKICWFCVALFEGTSPLKNASTLMVCLGKKKLGSTAPCIVPILVTHVTHAHTYFAEISSFVFSKQTKVSFVYVFEGGEPGRDKS